MSDIQSAVTILKKWGCITSQINDVLSLAKQGKNHKGSQTDNDPLSSIQLTRASYILTIDSLLRSTFTNPDNINGFMSMKNNNAYFSGKAPIELMEQNSGKDVEEVASQVIAFFHNL